MERRSSVLLGRAEGCFVHNKYGSMRTGTTGSKYDACQTPGICINRVDRLHRTWPVVFHNTSHGLCST
jgi:hypothetical protein